MKYRQYILGESLGMTFSAIIILIGIALFGNNESGEKTNPSDNIAESGIEMRAHDTQYDNSLKVTFLNEESLSVITESHK